MIKEAVECDVCGRTQIIIDPRHDTTLPVGWFRLVGPYFNSPSEGYQTKAIIRETDCCCQACTMKAVQDVYKIYKDNGLL